MNKEAILEGLLFVVGDEGITLSQIHENMEIDNKEALELIEMLKKVYKNENRGIKIEILGNSYKLTTKEEHIESYKKLMQDPKTKTLSQSSLETLAIIAYNEPVTRVKVDEIRGVSGAHIVRKLLAFDFIEEAGRADSPGRPKLYKTTDIFLDYFGLASLDELPNIEEFHIEELIQDEDLFQTKHTEV